MPGKTHQSTVAVIPPEGVWAPIQWIRRRYDRQIHRWPPHINLLYPFRPRSDFAAAAEELAMICSSIEPWTVTLAEFRYVRHSSGRCTLWLAPEPAEPLRQLQAALRSVFPDCDDLSRFSTGFTPHLSVGQFAGTADCQRRLAELQAMWEPLRFTLGEIVLLARQENSPFEIERKILLGETA